MILNFNLSETPETVPVVAPGEYHATIEKIEQQAAAGKRKEQVSFQFKIDSDGPEKGKTMFDGFPNEFLADKNSMAAVKLGNLVRSSGYVPANANELDMDQLLHKSVRFTVIHRNYTDEATQEAKVASNIKAYLYK
jgi:hypothetical protein